MLVWGVCETQRNWAENTKGMWTPSFIFKFLIYYNVIKTQKDRFLIIVSCWVMRWSGWIFILMISLFKLARDPLGIDWLWMTKEVKESALVIYFEVERYIVKIYLILKLCSSTISHQILLLLYFCHNKIKPNEPFSKFLSIWLYHGITIVKLVQLSSRCNFIQWLIQLYRKTSTIFNPL